MIRLATNTDLEDAKALTKACAEALQKRGIFQWNDQYPSREKLGNDIAKKELYLVEEKAKLGGIIVLTACMDSVYTPIRWLTPENSSLYVHRLAVHPGYWGKGFGQKLMDFAEYNAARQDFLSVRLDTFSRNERNQRFYETRGYKRLGNIYFPEKSLNPFFCYEKLMKDV